MVVILTHYTVEVLNVFNMHTLGFIWIVLK